MKKKNILIILLTVSLSLTVILLSRLIKSVSSVGKPLILPKIEVRLPDRMISVDFDSIYEVTNKTIDRTTLLVWIDSTHCMPCSVEYLYDYEPLDDRLKTIISDSVQIIAILSPKPSELEALKYKMKRERINFPVYIDESNDFQNLNPFFYNEVGELSICTDREGIYGLCKIDGLFHIKDESMAQLFIYNLSLLHNFNYEGVVIEREKIHSTH